MEHNAPAGGSAPSSRKDRTAKSSELTTCIYSARNKSYIAWGSCQVPSMPTACHMHKCKRIPDTYEQLLETVATSHFFNHICWLLRARGAWDAHVYAPKYKSPRFEYAKSNDLLNAKIALPMTHVQIFEYDHGKINSFTHFGPWLPHACPNAQLTLMTYNKTKNDQLSPMSQLYCWHEYRDVPSPGIKSRRLLRRRRTRKRTT